jgi:hypothetical protein
MKPSLTSVLQVAVKRAPNGHSSEQVADMLERRYTTLMNELAQQPGHKLGADLVLPIMEATGSLKPLHFLARQMGGTFVRLPLVDTPVAEATQQTIAAMRDFSELLTAVTEALKDGRVTLGELELIGAKGDKAVRAILTLTREMERMQVRDCAQA